MTTTVPTVGNRTSISTMPRMTAGVIREGPNALRVVPWIDDVADPHGVHPCSRYVELYWLGVIGPSTSH